MVGGTTAEDMLLPDKDSKQGILRPKDRKEPPPPISAVRKEVEHKEPPDCTPEQLLHDSSSELRPWKVSATRN